MEGGSFAQTIDDNINAHMQKGKYEIAIVLLGQLRKEMKKLSPKNELNYITCLYQTQRYLEALENIKRITDNYGTMRELLFMKGLCLYKLNKYQDAKMVFSEVDEWHNWVLKCSYMEKELPMIHLGESATPIPLNNSKNEYYQSNEYITNTIFAKGLTKDQVVVTFYPFSVDILIKASAKDAFMKSLELYDEIVPECCETKVSPIKIEIKMKKKKPAMWPTRDANLDLGMQEYDMDKALSQLCEIEDISDVDALKMFEQRQNETVKTQPNRR